MDRNYFLSYGQIAFLLLLSAIGKLNARIISGTVSKDELPHYTDINGPDLNLHLSDTFSLEFKNPVKDHHVKISNDDQSAVFSCIQDRLSIGKGKDTVLISVQSVKSVFVWSKWRTLSSAAHEDLLGFIKQVSRFWISSAKWVDGFEFIIKIPDKLAPASIK